MKSFYVTVHTDNGTIQYTAIALSSFDCFDAAIDQFGAIGVSVKPLEVRRGQV
jgi:hypothetical protein